MKGFKILSVILLVLSMLTFAACTDTPDDTTCKSHVDANNDGKCDECATEMTPACTECKDENNDGKCDACGKDVAKDPCTECKDENGDGKCDVCGGEVETAPVEKIVLVEKSGTKMKANFQLVISEEAKTGEIMLKVKNLVDELNDLKLEVNQVDDADTKAEKMEVEVLIGYAENRGEQYYINRYDYGMEGYSIQIIGTKVVIVAGSDASYSKAFEAFKTDFLGITSSSKKVGEVELPTTHTSTVVQDNYKINELTLNGNNIKGYTIAADKTDTAEYKAAKDVQQLLYSKTGYWLEIVPSAEADKSIIITLATKTGGDGYSATFNGNQMEFVCEYTTSITEEIYNFFNRKITLGKKGEPLDFSTKDNYTKNVRDVYYEDYGAVGDGKTDDTAAIRECHTYANKGGHTVCAKPNQKYYIGPLDTAITIKTDVNWGDAKFILDDAKIAPNGKKGDIFSVSRDSSSKSFSASNCTLIADINAAGGFDKDEITKIDLGLGYPAILMVYNTNHKNYIRYGVNANDGADQRELVLVDAEGNIDPTTLFMYDYAQITNISAYRIDDTPITIQGGLFEASPYLADTPQKYTAYGRGITIGRANVTMKNVKYKLVNEGSYNYNANTGDYGCPYGGFYSTSHAYNVLFEDCMMSAHVVYKGSNGAGMGTYGISPSNSINVTFLRCYQEDDNFFEKDGMQRWGVMGSSGSKNVTFDSCKLTRFDAHNGIHNAKIINSEMKTIRVNGTGTFLMENSIIHTKNFFGLREDYGGFWDGNIILKNNTMITTSSSVTLFSNTWYNHNFGYDAAFASNIVIDGLKIYRDLNKTPSTAVVNIFEIGILNCADKSVEDYFTNGQSYADGTAMLVANKNKVPAPERIIIRNCDREIVVPDKIAYPWFKNTIVEQNVSTVCTAHFDFDFNGHCDDCNAEFTCTNHQDINQDTHCTWCGLNVEVPCDAHIDIDRTGHCDICREKYSCTDHTDANSDHICDECKAPLCNGEHYSAKDTGYCDICYEEMPIAN